MLGGGGGGDLALLSVPVVSVPCQLPGPAAARKPYQIRSSVSSHHPTPATSANNSNNKIFPARPGDETAAGQQGSGREQEECETKAVLHRCTDTRY